MGSQVSQGEMAILADNTPALASNTRIRKHNIAASNASICDLVSSFATKKCDEMNKLISTFNETRSLGLWMDSKVPEYDKSLSYFISLKVSDKCEILNVIKKYLDFYGRLSNVELIKNANDLESRESAQIIIKQMHEDLSRLVQEALIIKDFTSSKTLYKLHNDIIAREKDFVRKLEKLELFISRESTNYLYSNFEKALNVVDNSQEQVKVLQQVNKAITDRFNKVMDEKEKLREELKSLVESSSITLGKNEISNF